MLEEVGFSRDQSETTVRILTEVMEDKLASKEDIRLLRQELVLLRSELIIKMGATLAAATGLIVTLIKIL
jgi:hypothetical protein